MKKFSVIPCLLLAIGIFTSGCLVTPAFAQDVGAVHELQRVIEAQQKQLEMQQEQLQLQQKQLDEQMQLMQVLQSQVKTLAEDSKATVQVPALAEGTKASGSVPADKVVTSGEERVKLIISGQVNRAVNIVDDGKNTEAYFVDNDNSESRVRFVGTAKINDDLTLGSRIELTIAPNKDGQVDQNNKETNNIFDQRWTEVSLESKRFGKLSLGKGATASYTAGAVDLSQTGVISYATIADTAGGMLFRQSNDDTLTNVRVSDAFNSLDGLNRQSRVRYDTPTFHGFHLATSAISDQRYDVSLWWGGQGYGFKAAGAVALANPNEDDTDFQYNGSCSLLHEETGLNLTLSAGLKERDNQGDAEYSYVKVGWLTRLTSFGDTAFGIDYARSLNQPTDNDEGYSIGAAAVQQFEKYGTEVYMLYRIYSLDRDLDPNVEDISVVSVGTRVKF